MDSLEKGSKSDEDSEMPEEEVDPRIQGELEKLNQSTDDINRWETELEDARQRFRAVLVEATVKLDEVVKKIRKPVDDSKPYWEARRVARQIQLEAQKASQDYQRAIEVVRVAKETISLAEQRLLEEDSRKFDSAWQEMLNHATQRLMEAEQTKARCELVHEETEARYSAAVSHMKQLEKKMKRTINKSKPYFELKAKYYLQLEQLKKQVDERQAKLTLAKAGYKTALRNLEKISDEIHERRRSSAMGPRGQGVGSECDSIAGDDIASFKMESDGISMVSVSFEDDNCNSGMSEEDSESPSTGSLSSSLSAAPLGPAHPCPSSSSPSSSPPSSPRPGQVSLCSFSLLSPVLGPRSECSGASSPECDLERGDRAEGAEGNQDDAVTPAAKNRRSLGSRLRELSLEQAASSERVAFAAAQRPTPTAATPPPALLVNGM